MTAAAFSRSPFPAQPSAPDQPIQVGRKIRTLIVDDQLLEREVLSRLLKAEPDVEIVGTSVNGRDAVEAIQRLKPDLAFLDVQMPELDGFGVVSNLDPAQLPVVVFVTANEEFARQAFDVQALDYLIKPCQRARLKLALHRVRRQLQARRETEPTPTIPETPRLKPLVLYGERLAVKTDGRILFLRLADISWIEAADNYVKLHLGDATHSLRDTLSSIEMRLPADRFLRISRSVIVNIDHIKELRPLLHGDYAVQLHDGASMTLTRNHRDKLRQLGF